jgi:hypothetical protein
MNKEYEAPSIVIISIYEMDIITTSGDFDDIGNYPDVWE